MRAVALPVSVGRRFKASYRLSRLRTNVWARSIVVMFLLVPYLSRADRSAPYFMEQTSWKIRPSSQVWLPPALIC